MQKWEYLFIKFENEAAVSAMLRKANEVGAQGWELVSTTSDKHPIVFLVFKRPLSN
jgi:hypothetical protein